MRPRTAESYDDGALAGWDAIRGTMQGMSRYLFSSHDGYGLGHVRRNALIGKALLDREPDATVILVTGVASAPVWLGDPRLEIVSVPPLVKDSGGGYVNGSLPFDEALRGRRRIFEDTLARSTPDVVVVDRHPYGIAGELRTGLEIAAGLGAALVLGLRDILDEPTPVRHEMGGEGWRDVPELFTDVLVYGEQHLCDHVAEYGLPVEPRYTGWVVNAPAPRARDLSMIAVSAGGGGDGDAVFALGVGVTELLSDRTAVIMAGPYASQDLPRSTRVCVRRDVPSCGDIFASAGAAIQMAGYNSTVEALAAGIRPILVPRRNPRREQAIRAQRLTAMGLADTVDEHAAVEEVAWLLGQSRLIGPHDLRDRGLRITGADAAADLITAMTGVPAP